jgi:hypothetical protein
MDDYQEPRCALLLFDVALGKKAVLSCRVGEPLVMAMSFIACDREQVL